MIGTTFAEKLRAVETILKSHKNRFGWDLLEHNRNDEIRKAVAENGANYLALCQEGWIIAGIIYSDFIPIMLDKELSPEIIEHLTRVFAVAEVMILPLANDREIAILFKPKVGNK